MELELIFLMQSHMAELRDFSLLYIILNQIGWSFGPLVGQQQVSPWSLGTSVGHFLLFYGIL